MKKCNFFLSTNPDFDAVSKESELSQAIRQGPLDFPEYVRLATKAKFYSHKLWDLLLFAALFYVLKYSVVMSTSAALAKSMVTLTTLNFIVVLFSAVWLSRGITKNRGKFDEQQVRRLLPHSLIFSDVQITMTGFFKVLGKNWGFGVVSTVAAMKTVLTTETYVLLPHEKEAIFVLGAVELDLFHIVHAHHAASAIRIGNELKAMKENYSHESTEPLCKV